ncbi:MAG: hypothetical protein C0608_07100 [Deltaproteobacteria bacterium]|nr:MAG: hypothetical protein C0608_07100 [Deltaproteobacteria bacterium]
MDTKIIWKNLEAAIAAMETREGDYNLKLETVMAGVELLYECPVEEILQHAAAATIPTRALVSWLVFEGERLCGVPNSAVEALRAAYEAKAPVGEGILKGPPGLSQPH